MPSNLIDLARAARQQWIGQETPPQSVAELNARLVALVKTPRYGASLLAFGPRDGPCPSPFAHLWTMRLADYACASTMSLSGPPDMVRTIEAQLSANLERCRPGVELVVVLHELPGRVDDLLAHAAEVDADARDCMRRAAKPRVRPAAVLR